jgi:hypothetical protein
MTYPGKYIKLYQPRHQQQYYITITCPKAPPLKFANFSATGDAKLYYTCIVTMLDAVTAKVPISEPDSATRTSPTRQYYKNIYFAAFMESLLISYRLEQHQRLIRCSW